MLTNRELDLFTIALRYCKLYDDTNPDVGMGPNLETLIKNIADSSGVYPTPTERQELIKRVGQYAK